MNYLTQLQKFFLAFSLLFCLSSCSNITVDTSTSEDTIQEEERVPAPITYGSYDTYSEEMVAQMDLFIEEQKKFAQVASALYQDPQDEVALSQYHEIVENLAVVIRSTETFSPPEELKDLHIALVDASFKSADTLDDFYGILVEGLDFKTEKEKLEYEGLSSYYSKVSTEYVEAMYAVLDAIALQNEN